MVTKDFQNIQKAKDAAVYQGITTKLDINRGNP